MKRTVLKKIKRKTVLILNEIVPSNANNTCEHSTARQRVTNKQRGNRTVHGKTKYDFEMSCKQPLSNCSVNH